MGGGKGVATRCVWAAVLAAAVFLAPGALGDLIEVIEAPSLVPHFTFISLGNGIAPGATGLYGFALQNRYNASMENITLTVEIYKWETVEEARNVSDLASPPRLTATGTFNQTFSIASIAPNASADLRAQVGADPRTPEGVYLTRHSLEFDYGNFTVPGNGTPRYAHFAMKSRGYFTAQEFASLNYSDLEISLEDLGVQGIIPDSSFSVKQPAPLWPLATLVVLTAATGTLSVAYWLAAENPGGHPRLTRALLRMEGKVRVWKFLAFDSISTRVKGRGRPPRP
jgi:hypothetical protein